MVTIDYENSRLTFIQPNAFKPNAASAAVSVTISAAGIPTIQASVNGHSGNFNVDTGSGQGLTVTQQFANSSGLQKELEKTVEAEIGRGMGGALLGTASRARALEIAAFTLPAPVVLIAHSTNGVLADPNLSGNIGSEIMRRFTVTLDVPAGMLYLRPNSMFSQPFVYNRAGLTVFPDATGQHVTDVIAGSPAAEAGVKSGDTLISVNGLAARTLDMAGLRNVWYGAVGNHVML